MRATTETAKAAFHFSFFYIFYLITYVIPIFFHSPRFAIAFFTAITNPLRNIPHVKSKNPLGFTSLTPELINQCRNAAGTNGIATAYMGCILVLFVTNNARRKEIVTEKTIGITSNAAARIINGITRGNSLLSQALVYTPWKNANNTGNEKYFKERYFLQDAFTNQVERWIKPVLTSTDTFLNEFNNSSFSLHELTRNGMLRIISTWMNIKPIDVLCQSNPKYFRVVDDITPYSIGKNYDYAFEAEIMDFGLALLKENLDVINETHYLGILFMKHKMNIPKTEADILVLDKNALKAVVMNMMSTVFGGGDAAPTVCEYALARLLADADKLCCFKIITREIDEDALNDLSAFHRNGALGFLCEHVLETIFLHPPFVIQAFTAADSLTISTQDEKAITLPSGSMIIADYQACNQDSKHIFENAGKRFFDMLKEQDTVRQFRMAEFNASCGGSASGFSRRCPVMVEAAYGITLFLYRLLKNFDISADPSVCLESDSKYFPVNKRYDKGEIVRGISDERVDEMAWLRLPDRRGR